MSGIALRSMVVGAVLLLESGLYYVANQKTEFQLGLDQLQISIDNNKKDMYLLEGRQDVDEKEYRSAKEIYEQTLQKAYWPAGLGGLFLVLGWVIQGAQRK